MGNQNGGIDRTSYKPHLLNEIVVFKTIPPFQLKFFSILGEEPEFEGEEAIVTGYATTLRFKLPDG